MESKGYKNVSKRSLPNYLDYYHKEKGYMLSFNFSKRKESGVREILHNNKQASKNTACLFAEWRWGVLSF